MQVNFLILCGLVETREAEANFRSVESLCSRNYSWCSKGPLVACGESKFGNSNELQGEFAKLVALVSRRCWSDKGLE